MKKILLCVAMIMSIMLNGCIAVKKDVSYKTKYVTNTESLEMREKPTNEASIICDLDRGEALSVVKDAENGYCEVVYNGVTGYVLAAYLTEEKEEPTPTQADTQKEGSAQKPQPQPTNNIDEDVENYVKNIVQPIYYGTQENLASYAKSKEGEATLWYDGKGYVKKEFPEGAGGYNMSRQYYYDTESGALVFAFIFKGTNEEHRLYIKNNEVVRYINPSKAVFDNPSYNLVSEFMSRALTEAY